jgi:O-antigen/teichoic acid export membrane protein
MGTGRHRAFRDLNLTSPCTVAGSIHYSTASKGGIVWRSYPVPFFGSESFRFVFADTSPSRRGAATRYPLAPNQSADRGTNEASVGSALVWICRTERAVKVDAQRSQIGKHRARSPDWETSTGGQHRGPGQHGRTYVRRELQSTHRSTHARGRYPSGQGRVRRAGFTVLIGSGLGSAVSMLLTPLISRMFDPTVYGNFALITSVTSVFVGVSTFCFEVQSLRSANDGEAIGLVRLGLIVASVWGAVLTLAAWLGANLWDLDGYWLWMGLLVFLASLQLLGSAVLTRRRRYRSLAAGNFFQGASVGVLQLLLGLVSGGLGALLTGFGAARLGWLPALRNSRSEVPGIVFLWRKHRRFAALAGSSAFINSLATSTPILLVSVCYGNATVGQLAIGIRLLVTPLSVIGQSAASANIGEVSRMLRVGDDTASRLVRHGMRDLLAIGLIPCGVAGASGAWAVPFFLGREWREAGLLLAALALGALAQFVAAPFAQLLNLTGDNRLLLIWNAVRFGATILSFLLGWLAGMSSVWAVGTWSAALVLVYGVLALCVLRAINRYRPQ